MLCEFLADSLDIGLLAQDLILVGNEGQYILL